MKTPVVQKNNFDNLYSLFIQELLQSKDGQKSMAPFSPFNNLKKEQIIDLISECSNVLQ